MSELRIGTRGSKLAMWQAERVKSLLEKGLERACELVKIKTTGDKDQKAPLSQIGGKGVFIKEIEAALVRGDIDLAVHSCKDLPSMLAPGTVLAAFPEREDPRDALVVAGGGGLSDLAEGARVGTGSLRRRCQLLGQRGDLTMLDIRGNVDTRLRKLREGQFDAILLACAGLKRLGMLEHATEILETNTLLPAVGQGVIAVQTRDEPLAALVREAIDDHVVRLRATAERAFLARFQGDCQVPVAAYAEIEDEGARLRLRAKVVSLDGSETIAVEESVALSGRAEDEEHVREAGTRAGEAVLERGGRRILEAIDAG